MRPMGGGIVGEIGPFPTKRVTIMHDSKRPSFGNPMWWFSFPALIGALIAASLPSLAEISSPPADARLPVEVLYYGEEKPLPKAVPLRAGPLTMIYEAGDLRYIRLGDKELVRRWYSATRDRNWGTLPVVLKNEKLEIGEDSFQIRYEVENKQGDIDFVWQGEIKGDNQGTITFSMDGVARSTFLRNRIGFCLLHPSEVAGARGRVTQADGTLIEKNFPRYIQPDAPFLDIQSLAHEVTPDIWARLDFEGDVFEMEDQRNWVDASFKTFCTPLRIPYPVEIPAGTKIVQRVTLTLEGQVEGTTQGQLELDDSKSSLSLEVGSDEPRPLLSIGLGVASHGEALTERELQRLRLLRPAHLRVDVTLAEPDHGRRLRRAAAEADSLGVPLEVALFLGDDAEKELQTFVELLQAVNPAIARWLVFHSDEPSTTERWVETARKHLRHFDSSLPIFTGTNAYFTELNRGRPNIDVADGVCYSINPQVHAFDNRSLVETLAAHGETVASARQFSGMLPLAVSPVTLKPRFNPNATAAAVEPPPGTLPEQVDVRQMSLFGAGWTMGSIKYLAESGTEHATYYETTGWRGVMETESGSPVPEKFRSLPGSAFPLFHVLADVAEFSGGVVIPTRSSDPLRVETLLLARGDHRRLLVANLTAETQTLALEGFPSPWHLRRLHEHNVVAAMRDPESYRSEPGENVTMNGGRHELVLAPFEVVRIDMRRSTD
jgi:D-apionolactonase